MCIKLTHRAIYNRGKGINIDDPTIIIKTMGSVPCKSHRTVVKYGTNEAP